MPDGSKGKGVGAMAAPPGKNARVDWPHENCQKWLLQQTNSRRRINPTQWRFSMYTPAAFRLEDLPTLHAQMTQTPLAIVVSHDENGMQASHLPLLVVPGDGPFGTLKGHFAKANPQWKTLQAGGEILVIFPGEQAYISPGYYPSKAEHGKAVPTWNYIAIHAYGQAETFDAPERLRPLLHELTHKHEHRRAQPWTLDEAPPA